MAEVIALDERRRQVRARRAFRIWERRFRTRFDEKTTIRDLPDEVLAALVETGEAANLVVQSLVITLLTGKDDLRFEDLGARDKIRVIDRCLFLVDRIRFECMHRLGWVEADEAAFVPMVQILEEFDHRFAAKQNDTPALVPDHPRYAEFAKTFEGDRASFVRRLIPKAIETFKSRLEG